jgi:hypothetical protein
MLVSAPWRCTDKSVETCRSYGKDCTPKLENNAFVGVNKSYLLYPNYMSSLHKLGIDIIF